MVVHVFLCCFSGAQRPPPRTASAAPPAAHATTPTSTSRTSVGPPETSADATEWTQLLGAASDLVGCLEPLQSASGTDALRVDLLPRVHELQAAFTSRADAISNKRRAEPLPKQDVRRQRTTNSKAAPKQQIRSHQIINRETTPVTFERHDTVLPEGNHAIQPPTQQHPTTYDSTLRAALFEAHLPAMPKELLPDPLQTQLQQPSSNNVVTAEEMARQQPLKCERIVRSLALLEEGFLTEPPVLQLLATQLWAEPLEKLSRRFQQHLVLYRRAHFFMQLPPQERARLQPVMPPDICLYESLLKGAADLWGTSCAESVAGPSHQ